MTAMLDYLSAFPQVKNARDVRIKILGNIYNAVEYLDTVVDKHQHVLIVYGGLPPSKRRRNKTVYRFAGDERDWYVACYATVECLQPRFAPFHQFGLSFQLRPWSVPSGDAIDRYDEHKYTRIKCDVTRERF